ncbi:MAG: HEAT repeat domain-containing protein [Planctomycetes bacterium]|nr:HEAT repeat domain-containing protein [Planctomycetota bacterium]
MKQLLIRFLLCLILLHLPFGLNLPLHSQSKVDIDSLKKEIRGAKDELKKIGVFEKIKQVSHQLSISDKIEISKELVMLLSDSSANIRSITAVQLGELGAKQYTEDIAGLLDDTNVLVKTGATIALGNLGAMEYSQNIAGFLAHRDAGLRGTAAEALGKLGAVEYIKDITALLGDSDSSVRDKATKALVKLNESRPKKIPDEPSLLSEEDKVWRSDKWGFKVTFPSDWNVDILDKSEGILVARFSDKPNGISGLIAKDYSESWADEYLKGVLESLKEDGGLEVVVKPKGKLAANMVYICDIEGTSYQYYVRVVDVDGSKLRIVFYCSAKLYNKYEDLFARYAETLEGISAAVNKNVKTKDKTWTSEKWSFELTLPSDWKMDIYDKKDGVNIAKFTGKNEKIGGYIKIQDWSGGCKEFIKSIIDSAKDSESTVKEVEVSGNEKKASGIFTQKSEDVKYYYYIYAIGAGETKLWTVIWCDEASFDEYEDALKKYAGTLKAVNGSSDDIEEDTKVWRSSRWGFEISLPSDWEIDIFDEDENGRIAKISGDSDAVYGSVYREKSDGRADEYLEEYLDALKKEYKIDMITEPKGKSEATAVFIGEVKGASYQNYVRAISSGEEKIRVFFNCKTDQYDKYEKIFAECAKSLILSISSGVQEDAGDTKIWRSSRWGFEISLPSDWKMDILEKIDGIMTAKFSNEEEGVYGLIAQEDSEEDCDEYLSGLVEQGVKDGTKEIILKPEGKTDATLVYTYDIEGLKYEYYMRVIDVAGIKLRLVFYCKKSVYGQYEKIFKNSAKSFKVW